MGFWKDVRGRRIGDGPLDAAEEFLAAVAADYREQFGSLPSLEELLETIRLPLELEPANFIKGGAKVSVTAISAKTRKRQKRQTPRSGDIVVIPINESYFAFGHLTPQRDYLEFFNVKSRRIVAAHSLSKFSKIIVDFEVCIYSDCTSPLEGHRQSSVESLQVSIISCCPRNPM